MKIIKVNLKENSYNIYVGFNLIKNIPSYIKNLNIGNFAFVITSNKIYSLYNKIIKKIFDNIECKVLKVIDGEKAKSKIWLFRVIEELLHYDQLNRKIFIVCFGGGTIGDLGSFVASIYKRGTPYIQIPTTLLSQIDAGIGGKTAINLKEAKNILGTFYQPKAVFIDPIFLYTLPPKQLKEGVAEIIKYGIIKRKELFDFLKNNYEKIISLKSSAILKVIIDCIKIKANIISKDEKEKKGIRTILNFGHTFAHALENYLSYRKISHGEAVSLGMLYAGYLSFLLGKCKFNEVEKIKKILDIFSLPTKITYNYLTLYKILKYDKKFITGKIRMVLLKKIGQVQVVDNIPPEKIIESLKNFSASQINTIITNKENIFKKKI